MSEIKISNDTSFAKKIVVSRLFCKLILGLIGPAYALDAFAQDSTVTITTETEVSLTAGNAAPVFRTNSKAVDETLSGQERSMCVAYGRSSSAQGSAKADILDQGPNRITVALNSRAYAQGGHYRTCAACAANACIAISGNDTKAQANALVSARIKLQFGEKLLTNAYDVRVTAAGQNAGFEAKLTGPDGKPIPLSANGSGTARLTVDSNQTYYATFTQKVTASNEGGCCSSENNGNVQVTVQVLKAPILESVKDVEPFIIGGIETPDYPSVVAILLNGSLHCSGTIVAGKTVLTAAHCIHGFEDRVTAGDFSVVAGQNVMQPTLGPIKLVDFDFPRGPDVRFNPRRDSLEHDIGLLFTSEPISVEPSVLHDGAPSLSALIAQRKSLYFVGYGLTKSAGGLVGQGIKRYAPWTASQFDDSRFFFQVPNRNTCKGDSGGPAFLDTGPSSPLLLIGITSAGDANCTQGVDTRVDAHLAWLKPKLR